jgi:hypothetical protein
MYISNLGSLPILMLTETEQVFEMFIFCLPMTADHQRGFIVHLFAAKAYKLL